MPGGLDGLGLLKAIKSGHDRGTRRRAGHALDDRSRGHPGHRVRHHRHRGRGDEAGRVRLPDQAVPGRRDQRRDRPRAREARAGRGRTSRCATSSPAAPASRSLLGKSRAMQKVFELIGKIHSTRTSVLITGESGTGKELVARALHSEGSAREGAVRRGQLRRDPRGADGVRAVRAQEGRVHRRGRRQAGPVPGGRRRHAVPRRDRRAVARPPGQAAARAPGAQGQAGRRAPRSSRSTSA